MSEEEQRIAIAEACGWEKKYSSMYDKKCWYNKLGTKVTPTQDQLPDYLNDLNAMHEAEKIFDYALYCRYINELCDVTIKGNNSMYMATAAQRAEAFLKTIGKWKGKSHE
jgi:hypothetical protein